MILLAIDWSSVAVKTGQFILSFSILVILHELGHFLPAKWFKCRVEKFYLFFNPWISLWKKKVGETEYGLGWVPFGGYVKISGMVDESMDKEQLKKPAEPYEFRSKPAWQRLIIMIGGVVVNILLAIFLFVMIMFVWGENYLPPQNLKYGIVVDSVGEKIGLKNGDIITKVNNKPVVDESKVVSEIILNEAKQITIVRDGQESQLNIPETLIRKLNTRKGQAFVSINIPAIVASVKSGSNAEKAGIQKDDRFIGVDSLQTSFAAPIQKVIHNKKNQQILLKVQRGQNLVQVPVQVSKDGIIGVMFESDLEKLGFKVETKNYSFAESVPAGFRRAKNTLTMYVTGLKQLFTGKADPNESLGSVISIGNVFPGVWDWESFWTLTAVFSVILAFMNILPIPALDGGHALFTIVEMVTGRKPSDKFMEYAQMVGMVLLLGLMAYALGLDFWRLFR